MTRAPHEARGRVRGLRTGKRENWRCVVRSARSGRQRERHLEKHAEGQRPTYTERSWSRPNVGYDEKSGEKDQERAT